jgi:hypothetical protein
VRRASSVPERLAWLFPEVDIGDIDTGRDRHYVLARILERGRCEDVMWCRERYGLDGIRAFFRERARWGLSEPLDEGGDPLAAADAHRDERGLL